MALGISLAVHTAALVGVVLALPDDDDAAGATQPAQKPEQDVVAVELIDEPEPVEIAFYAPASSGGATATAAAPTAAHIATGRGTAPIEVGPGNTAKPTGGKDLIGTMRPDERPSIDTGSIIASIADNGKPPPPPIVPSGKLHSTGGGTARIDDEVTTVTVDSDGNAHFHDKPSIDIHFLPGLPNVGDIRKDIGAGLEAWREDPYRDQRNGTTQDLPETQRAVPGECDHYGDNCMGAPTSGGTNMPAPGTVTLLGGNADITDYLMRKLGNDPYAARKKKLLDSTFDERAEQGATHRSEQLQHSAVLMHDNLVALWRATTDAGQRKETLFELWDECTEGDEAGDRARNEVIGWIRAKLPQGSTGAFTAGEITQLSGRRTSKQAFAPYDE